MTGVVARWIERLESDSRVPWALAFVWCAAGIYLVLSDRFLHDEGLLTYYFAAMALEQPAALLFMQKSRPILSAFYAPAAASGFNAFLVLHMGVAALAIPLIGDLSRRLGHRAPNVAALVVATSPLFIAAGASGVSNSDATTLSALCLWLLMGRQRPGLAGVTLGLACLARYELALLIPILWIWAVKRDQLLPLAAGTLMAPAAYWAAGILYHRHALWWLMYPPSLTHANPASPLFDAGAYGASTEEISYSLLAVSPALVLLPLLVLVGLRSREWALAAFVLAFLAFILGLPQVGLFNFDTTPRYLLPVLPFVALLVGRTADLAVARQDGLRWASAVGAALLVAAPVWLLERTGLAFDPERAGLEPVAQWLEDPAQGFEGRTVVTNAHLLGPWTRRHGRLRGLEVRQMVLLDQLEELRTLTNPAVGQTDALLGALERHFYAEPVMPEDLHPDRLPEGTLLALGDDPRLNALLPDALWAGRLRTLLTLEGWRIAEVVPPGTIEP